MPAIPVYSASPINASKAQGVTPQTAHPEDAPKTPYAPATTTSANSQQGYPPAQPAARPSIPVPTGVPQSKSYDVQPTPTQIVPNIGPPGPQPGAVPVHPVKSQLPPPPKTGEVYQPLQTTMMPMPPQMSYPVSNSTYCAPGGSSISSYPSHLAGPRPTSLREAGPAESTAHPPGYHQNPYASEFSSHQRAAYEAQGGGVFGDEEGVWDTAKKWASAAGNSLAAAEEEVWKRINKD